MREWSGASVLVTGAGGFIGSRLVEQLARADARVRAFVRYTSRRDLGGLGALAPDLLRRVEIVAGDLRDESAVRQATAGVDVVFHLAALIAIPYSYEHPREVVQTNVVGTLNVLMAAREHRVPRLVHTSTSEVYGTARYVPIDESHPLQGQSPYSASKIGADKLAESFHLSFGLPLVTVRPFNTYGPGQSLRAVIPTIVAQALVGDTVRLGRVDPVRDFMFVDDTVAGFMAAGASDADVAGGVFNLGTGVGVSVRHVVEQVGGLLGKRLLIVEEPERVRPEASEVHRLIADASLATRTFGWTPMVSLSDGLRRTIDWMRTQSDKYEPELYYR